MQRMSASQHKANLAMCCKFPVSGAVPELHSKLNAA